MRFLRAVVVVALTASLGTENSVVFAKRQPGRPSSSGGKPVVSRSSSASSSRVPTPRSVASSRGNPSTSRNSRRPALDEEEMEEDVDDNDADEYENDDESPEPVEEDIELVDDDDYEEIIPRSKSRADTAGRVPPRKAQPLPSKQRADSISSSRRKRPPPQSRFEEDEDYVDYRREPPRRGPPRRPGTGGGRVVPYAKPSATATFTKGWATFRSYMPDPAVVKEAALSSISAARETTSNLGSNLYREVKGLTSSELEQVMLKATRPDDTPVKGKHVERLVGVTYQINARYDIYDAVLRKLWAKMAEKDWRTTMKALYILHRFSADGAPDHAPALKARLRELRRTRDPKRKDKYFSSKLLLAGDSKPETVPYRAFMSRYAHYVLLRAQCFSGMFDEISQHPTQPDKKKSPTSNKPITSTSLRQEHLNAAEMLLKAGIVCQLKEGEECENTAIAAERVASDMIGMTTAVAVALNRVLKDKNSLKNADTALVKNWCKFYSEDLLPQTKSMIKKLSPKLDAYGLFLPSRMGASVSQDLLELGLNLEEDATTTSEDESPRSNVKSTVVTEEEDERSPVKEGKLNNVPENVVKESKVQSDVVNEDQIVEAGVEFDEEYEYEEDEYYDDEEE